MKAIFLVRHGDPKMAFETRSISDLEPGENQVTIDVEGFGLNFADVQARNGLYPDMPPMPCVLGYEVVGRIAKLGNLASGYKIGDRVVGFTRFGAYATLANTDFRAVCRIGEHLPLTEALALATQYATAYYASHMALNLNPGDKVLVHSAAGGVGIALCQLAKLKGCEVYATAGSEAKLNFLRSHGIMHVFNYQQESYTHDITNALTGAKLDVIFNAIAGKSIKSDMQLLGAGGRLVIYGAASRVGKRGGILGSIKLLVQTGWVSPLKLLMGSKSVIGINMLRISDYKPELMSLCLREVVQLAENGSILPYVSATYPVEQLAEAHQALENRSTIGKVGVKW